MSAPAKERARAWAGDRAKKKAKARGGLATVAVSKDTLHESAAPKGKGKDKNWLPPQQWTQYNPGFIAKQWNYWRPGNSKGNGKGPDQSHGKGRVSVIGQEGLIFHSWGA